MSDADLMAAIEALRTDIARQHREVVARLDAILAALPPPPPDLNPLGGLMPARSLEQLLTDLRARLNRGTAAAPAATVLPFPRSEAEP
jgi:hypothetical protein